MCVSSLNEQGRGKTLVCRRARSLCRNTPVDSPRWLARCSSVLRGCGRQYLLEQLKSPATCSLSIRTRFEQKK
ncbi:hypothetical protein DIPPA_63148 [Diplonema papillatum]|nr:hypothetical protein DIPPA_63148 [Diplonema papillatum]